MDLILETPWPLFLQLIVATSLGMLLGLERAVAGKVAGMRTYGLVSMGACLFIVISMSIAESFQAFAPMDPLRVVEGVVTGVGFIGAGIILFRESELRGLTTAAGLWIAAAIGVATGFGLYAVAVFATILTLLVFTVMWSIENKIRALIARSPLTTESAEHELP